jgi:putative transposase
MPQSLAKVLLHTVFSTKNRTPFLRDRVLRRDLHSYLAAVLNSIDCPALIVGGVEDHVHILGLLSRTRTIAQMLEELKTSTSKWIKSKDPSCADFHWQNGYGVFSVSESKVSEVRQYIERQEEHHRTMTFQDEFRELCRRHGVPIDERYVWD